MQDRHAGNHRRALLAVLTDNGFLAVILYRLSRAALLAGLPVVPAVLHRLGIFLTSADLSPHADIGPGLVLAHGVGTVVGGTVRVGRDAVLLHGVTLGERSFDNDHVPTLGDRVTVSAGAKILGAVRVGDDATVGANAVVLSDVRAGAKVGGIPARELVQRSRSGADDNDTGI